MSSSTSSLKRKIMLKLCDDAETFKIITNSNISSETPEDLIGVNIFPHLKVDYTIEQTGTYIGIKLEYPSINENKIYKNARLTFLIVSANGHLKVKGGYCRTDLLAEQILNLFNWSDIIGFDMEIVSDIEDPLNENFYFRKLVFKSIAPNSMKNGVKVN